MQLILRVLCTGWKKSSTSLTRSVWNLGCGIDPQGVEPSPSLQSTVKDLKLKVLDKVEFLHQMHSMPQKCDVCNNAAVANGDAWLVEKLGSWEAVVYCKIRVRG